jgi:aldehyde:ferredoxin oxidoreductase
MFERRWGDRIELRDGDYDRGNVVNDLCTQYGIDRWDVVIWLMTWLAMGKRERVLDDIDLGMEIDPASEEFMQHSIENNHLPGRLLWKHLCGRKTWRGLSVY